MTASNDDYDGTTEQQIIDEDDDYARLNAANRNANNLSFGAWMRLGILHYLVWAAVIGCTIGYLVFFS